MNELLTRLGYFDVHHQRIRSVCWLFIYNVLFKRGICIALSRVERGTGTYVPEERADRSKGIRGAEDGQSGSRASSPRDSGRRGGIREYGRKEKEHIQQEGRQKGGTVVGDKLWGRREEERQIYFALTGISSNSNIWQNFIKSVLNYTYDC